MGTNYYLEKLYQDMRLRAYSEHTQDVYGRAVRSFLGFSGKSAESLLEIHYKTNETIRQHYVDKNT